MPSKADHSPAPVSLLLLVALAAEAAVLERSCRQQTAGSAVRVLRCGIGCNAVLRAARLHDSAAGLVGSIGVSGGLAPDLAPGTVVVAGRIRARHPELDPVYDCTPAVADLLERLLRAAGVPWRRGTLLCVDEPLLTPEAKLAAHRRSGALAVDLESAAAAHVARAAGRPFFCLRVICDPATRRLAPELLRGVDMEGNTRPLRLLTSLTSRPWLLIRLLRMARDFSMARRGMAQAWQTVCGPLAAHAISDPDRGARPSER